MIKVKYSYKSVMQQISKYLLLPRASANMTLKEKNGRNTTKARSVE